MFTVLKGRVLRLKDWKTTMNRWFYISYRTVVHVPQQKVFLHVEFCSVNMYNVIVCMCTHGSRVQRRFTYGPCTHLGTGNVTSSTNAFEHFSGV